MPQRIQIPQSEIDKLFDEVSNLTDDQVRELGETYQKRLAMQGGYMGDPEKRRLNNAIRRKRMTMIVDRAKELGLLPQKSRKELRAEMDAAKELN